MQSWYSEFESKTVNSDLKKYYESDKDKNTPKINEKELRASFLNHARQILQYYGDDSGRLANYLDEIQIFDKLLDEVAKTGLGYKNLLFEDSASRKKMNAALEKAEAKLNPLSVTCEAERDFVLLIKRYVNFMVDKNRKSKFDSWSANWVLARKWVRMLIEFGSLHLDVFISTYEILNSLTSTTQDRPRLTTVIVDEIKSDDKSGSQRQPALVEISDCDCPLLEEALPQRLRWHTC